MGLKEIFDKALKTALDVKDVEMIRNTYDIQKDNNIELKQNVELLRQLVESLQKENERLKMDSNPLPKKIEVCLDNLSKPEHSILKLYKNKNMWELDSRDIFEHLHTLKYDNIQIDYSIDVLLAERLIKRSMTNIFGDGPAYYELTTNGKKLLL